MGYPVSPNAPRITHQSRTFCVSAFEWSTPVGAYYKVGVYELMPSGEWNELQMIAQYMNSGDCLADVKKLGGGVKYIQYIIQQANLFFKNLFGTGGPIDSTEPTTDTEARKYLTAQLSALKFTVVNNIPVLG